MRVIIVHDPTTDKMSKLWDLERYLKRWSSVSRVDTVHESEHTRNATKEIFEQERLEKAYRCARNSWSGTDNDPHMNLRGAGAFTNSTHPDDHERGCNYRDSIRGICSCSVIKEEYFRRAANA